MPDVLIASDAEAVHREVAAVLAGPDTVIRHVYRGPDVTPAVAERTPDIVITDMQMGNMGGFAVALDLRLEEGAGRIEPTPILILLDRRADVFLARRSSAQGWILKPLDPIRLRRAVRALLEGGTYHDDSYIPQPVAVPASSGNVEGSGK